MREQDIDTWTQQLVALLLDIASTAQKAGKRHYIGGGFAVDLAFGGISRSHEDIDFHPMEEDTEWWKDWFRWRVLMLFGLFIDPFDVVFVLHGLRVCSHSRMLLSSLLLGILLRMLTPLLFGSMFFLLVVYLFITLNHAFHSFSK